MDGQATRMNAAEKTVAVLESLSSRQAGSTLAQVSAEVGVAKPTAHRILQTLVEQGFVIAEGRGVYTCGPRLLALAGRVLAGRQFARHARPAVVGLRDATGFTVHFAIRSGNRAIYVDKVEADQPYRMASRVGMSIPLYCTSIGKAILAALAPEEVVALLDGVELAPRTEHTITSLPELLLSLDEVRRRGFAVDEQENENGVRCVGAAVSDSLGEIVGAVSVSSLAFSLPDSRVRRTGVAVRAAAAEISAALGAASDGIGSDGAR